MHTGAPLIIALVTLLHATTPAQVLEQIVVNVNGEILTKRDLEERQLAAISGELGRPIAVTELRGDPALQRRLDALMPMILAEAVDELLVVQHARELGLDATDEDVVAVLAAIKADNELETEAELWSFLQASAMAPARRRESVRRKILAEQVRQHATRRVQVSEEDARAFFVAHRGMFATPATVSYREIFVAVPPEPPLNAGSAAHQARDKAIMRFVAARDRLLKGETFSEVAARYSEKTQGLAGEVIGPVALDDLPGPLQAALTRLQPGEVSPPTKADDGYRLLKLETLVPASSPPFEAARDAVIDRASADLRLAAARRYMNRLRESALITWKIPALQEVYDRRRQQR